MPYVTALVDIGLAWPAGTVRHVTDGRAVLMINAGWVESVDTPKPKKRRKASPKSQTENPIAVPATETRS